MVIWEDATGRMAIEGAASDDDEAAREDDEEAEVGVVIVKEIGSKELSLWSSDTIK